ncbi:MAG: hypothetical protein ACRDVM_01220 [Acidimicrobiia bacterium]
MVSKRSVDRRTWSPAQIVAAGIGLFLIVLGGVALARTGFAAGLPGDTTEVAGFGHTALFGIVEIIVGLLFLAGAGGTYQVRGSLTTLGVISLAFGIILAIEPAAFQGAFGTDSATGWLYAAIGGVSLLAAWLSPTIHVDRERVSDQREHHSD